MVFDEEVERLEHLVAIATCVVLIVESQLLFDLKYLFLLGQNPLEECQVFQADFLTVLI